MKYLKKYVKMRKEDGYILLCDCSTIQNYELPNDMYDFLIKLKNGCDETKLFDDIEKDLIDDLEKLELIDNIPNSDKGFHDKNWINLEYDESEFYK